jgi:D-psicose/D-tagatose/L-ribulose 3-epimerase
MKFGVNMMVWTTRVGKAHEALFGRIHEWGFDGVEPFLSTDIPEDIPRLRAVLDQHGLERTTCVVLPREANLVSADAMTRARGVDFLKKCVDRTAELGGRLMCGPLYAALGVMTGFRRTEDEWKWAVDGLQKAAEHARRQNVTLCPEPLNRFETYFLNTLEDAARFVRDVGAPNVKIHFDTFHSNIEEQHPVESLHKIIRDVGHVHLSENDRGIPGTGHCDWRGILEVLKENHYSGWLTIESFAQPEPDLAAAAAIWRDLAPTGDDLARQGLSFIKGLAREVGIS